MRLTHLRDVLAVAEMGSLRAAARYLNMAQPQITRSIREIEKELGAPLFERHAKGIQLTEIGIAFVRRADSIQAELRRIRDEVEQLKGNGKGEISVALSTATCISLMPSAVVYFRKKYPNAIIKISESLFQPIEGELADGKIDFYVGPLDKANLSAQFAVEELFGNRRMVFARKGHPLASAKSFGELTNAQWIRPTLSTRATEGDFDTMFERLGLPQPNIVIHARSALITLAMIADSDLLSILPTQFLNVTCLRDVVVPLKLREQMVAAPMCVVRRRSIPLTPIAEHLCDAMQRAAAYYANDKRKAAVRSSAD